MAGDQKVIRTDWRAGSLEQDPHASSNDDIVLGKRLDDNVSHEVGKMSGGRPRIATSEDPELQFMVNDD